MSDSVTWIILIFVILLATDTKPTSSQIACFFFFSWVFGFSILPMAILALIIFCS